MFKSQWNRWVRRNGQARRTVSRRPALRLEALEGREVPSAAQYGASIALASQSYNHPDATGTGLSGQVVPFFAMAFRVSADDVYTLTNTANTYPNGDTFFSLYQTAFNPGAPLQNLLQVNDNYVPLGNKPQ